MQALRTAILVIAAAVPLCRTPAAEAKPGEAFHRGRPVSAWRADLGSDSPQTRFDALVALGAIGPDADAALGDVRRRLRDAHPDVRRRAVSTLAALGPAGYDVVIATLEDEDAALRGICCDALTWGEPPRRKAAAALRRRLADPIGTVRYLAAFALTAVDPMSDDALPVLQQALRETNPAAVIGACTAAARLGHRARPLLAALLSIFRYTDEKALVAAAQALRGMDPSISPRVIERAATLRAHPSGRIVLLGVLGHLGQGNARVATQVLPFLRDANGQVAMAAIDTLVAIGTVPAEVGQALETAAMGELGHAGLLRPKALEALAALELPLADRVRGAIRIALARDVSPEEFGPLLNAFPNGLAVLARAGDPGAPVRARARWLRALVAGAPGARDPTWAAEARRRVLDAVRYGPADLREQAADHVSALFAADPTIIGPLARAARSGGGPACGRALARLLIHVLEDRDPWHTVGATSEPVIDPEPWREAGRAARETLDTLVRGDDVEASLAARIALAYLSPESTEALTGCLSALGGADLALRRAAAACLATLEPGTPEVIAALARVIRNRSESAVVRRTAAVALARQGRAADTLIAARVREARGAVRRFWLVALGRAGVRLESLLPEVLEDLESEQDAIRDAAIEAITAMGPAALTAAPAAAALLGKRSRRRRVAGMQLLAALGPAAGPWVGAMFDAVAAEPRGERARFAGWLTQVGGSAVPVLVQEAAASGSWERRLVALNVLARIGRPTAAKAAGLAGALTAEDSTVRVAVCDLLELLGPDASAAKPALVGALRDPVGRVRAGAARALAAMGPLESAARSALVRIAEDDAHAFVRIAARDALRAAGASGVEGEDDR